MIRINQLKLELTDGQDVLINKAAAKLKIDKDNIKKLEIVKRSIDARHKPQIKYVYSVNVVLENENKLNKKIFNNDIFVTSENIYKMPKPGNKILKNRPVIVGMGPAGLFCGYYLARAGYRPIIIERGKAVEERMEDVEKFFQGGSLNTESNVQFGEGGAGTFSDGKLNTLVKDKDGRNREVLKAFVRFGANEEILYSNKPHIGTDVLSNIVKNMRQEIISLGGEVRFSSKLTDIFVESGRVSSIEINHREKLECQVLVLAVGHSARDTFSMLLEKKLNMEAKAFAVGVRLEHPQSLINKAMYGIEQHEILEAADYKVTYNTRDKRGVYSFCMCPGGYVVNASSEEEMLAVNGMSYSKRDGKNANSAIIVTVTPEDYGKETPLDGMYFQRELEKKAFQEGGGNVPVQTFGDFEKNIETRELKSVEPSIKGSYTLANVRKIFPDYIGESIVEGIHGFAKQIPGFDMEDGVVSGVESRTSSPVRILRDNRLQSSVEGIFPCGEGAGYAGGITSAAMDGIKVFEAVAVEYRNISK